jgi:hypoxanthine phosphoribosyltransferase
MTNTLLDHNHIALRLEALAPALRTEGYDALACILRGGAFLGVEAAFATGLPLHFIDYRRADREVRWRGEPPKGRRLLLCEDFAGSGHTLADCLRFVAGEGYLAETLVICVDHSSALPSRWALFESTEPGRRFVLPWERYRLNAPSVSDRPERPDHEHGRTAWDLDGIFVADVEAHHYRSDLNAALAHRDTLPLAPWAPLPEPEDVIVTGRPLSDAERTLAWCGAAGISLRVHFRDDGNPWPTAQEVAAFKAARALELGCTQYVESDAAQAAELAAQRPELTVIWWNEGRPQMLRAAPLAAIRRAPAP